MDRIMSSGKRRMGVKDPESCGYAAFEDMPSVFSLTTCNFQEPDLYSTGEALWVDRY